MMLKATDQEDCRPENPFASKKQSFSYPEEPELP
jgi:hypothetical protein